MVSENTLAKLDDQNLAVYVVWVKVMAADSQAAAMQSRSEVKDPRARHFWSADLTLAKAFGRTLTLPLARDLAWDVYLAFSPNTAFGEVVPAPEQWFHQLGLDERHLGDGSRLTSSLLDLLDAD